MEKTSKISNEEQVYNKVMAYFDLADDMLAAIEDIKVKNADEQFALARPLVEQLQESAELLGNSILEYVKKGNKTSPKLDKEVEAAIRKIYTALDMFKDGISDLAKKYGGKR